MDYLAITAKQFYTKSEIKVEFVHGYEYKSEKFKAHRECTDVFLPSGETIKYRIIEFNDNNAANMVKINLAIGSLFLTA